MEQLKIGWASRPNLAAALDTACSTKRRAISCMYPAFRAVPPYRAKQVSGLLPARTGMSVDVMQSNPPSTTACTAASRNGEQEPYGSKSMTSYANSGCDPGPRARRPYMWPLASAQETSTRELGTPLCSRFRRMCATALGSRSLATMCRSPTAAGRVPGPNSLAYRMERMPVAARASKSTRPGSGATLADGGRPAASALSAFCLRRSSASATSAARRLAKTESTRTDRSRLKTCAGL
mmetsp:Transcript_2758/g.10905  ORF Transcript_2758/g.10905 Transcript_2758/m.10905 type:complete len:237 (+) Transcript_2758:981-1691(+)